MAFYNNNIHTSQINPTSNSTNFRSEFRLNAPDCVYLSNIRLCNVGLNSVTGVHNINQLAGLLSCIKNITLFDGNVVLDQVLNFNLYAAFKSGYNKTNDDNISKWTNLIKNNYNFVTLGETTADGEDEKVDNIGLVSQIATTDSPQAWISIKDTLSLLSQSSILPTAIYKDLRLVIEYETDIKKICPNTQGGIRTLEPFLIVDEITNEQVKNQMIQSYGGASFNPVEYTRVVADAMNPASSDEEVEQKRTYTINSFNNKTLNRLLVIKTGTEQTVLSSSYGSLASEHQNKESVQVIVNGSNLLAGDGLTSDQTRLAMLYDLWGDAVQAVPNNWLLDNANAIENANDQVGRTDYTSVLVQNFVNNFQYTFGRKSQFKDGAADQTKTRYNQKLILNMFGEVNKVIQASNGQYSIRYV